MSILDIDECAGPQTCANGGLCKNIEGSFECSCAAGWTGSNCTEGTVALCVL